MCLNFVGERAQKCDRDNREWWWCQIKSIYRLHLDLVVKKLCYINCLNAWATSCAAFRNQSYVVLLSFYIKMMKGRRLQACSLRHSIKKGMLSVQAKLDLFKSGRGEYSPSPSPPLATRLLRASILKKICKRLLLEIFYKKNFLKNCTIFTGRKWLVISVL